MQLKSCVCVHFPVCRVFVAINTMALKLASVLITRLPFNPLGLFPLGHVSTRSSSPSPILFPLLLLSPTERNVGRNESSQWFSTLSSSLPEASPVPRSGVSNRLTCKASIFLDTGGYVCASSSLLASYWLLVTIFGNIPTASFPILRWFAFLNTVT